MDNNTHYCVDLAGRWGLPSYSYSRSWGYFPMGDLGTILVIVLILVLLGVI